MSPDFPLVPDTSVSRPNPLTPSALVLRRNPFLPVLAGLHPDIYGAPVTKSEETADGLAHLDTLVTQYGETGVPFIVVNMGLPKSGKTILSGEQLAFVSRRLYDQALRRGAERDFRSSLAYIPYESVQRLVEQTGEVPQGNGPGHQTPEDHIVSSKRMTEEIRMSLASGQNVIAEAPFIAGRGDLGLLYQLATRKGKFAGLEYNVRFMWPIPDRILAIHALTTRAHFAGRDRISVLQERNVRIHSSPRSEANISGASEDVLQMNFNGAASEHLGKLHTMFKSLGFAVDHLDFFFEPFRREQSSLILLTYLRQVAPYFLTMLQVPPQESLVGTNRIILEPIEYYTDLLRYYDKFRQ